MRQEVHKVRAFEIVGPHRFRIELADGLSAVALDREVHTLVWPNGADFDPATLRDWPEHEAAMAELARKWASSASGRPTR